MPGGKGNITGSEGNTFSSDNQPKNNGRKPSIKNQLKQLALADGKLKIPAKNVLEIDDDGNVTIRLPTEMQLAMKLNQWALSKKGNDSLKAIQMIMEQLDGKAVQPTKDETPLKKVKIRRNRKGEVIKEYLS